MRFLATLVAFSLLPCSCSPNPSTTGTNQPAGETPTTTLAVQPKVEPPNTIPSPTAKPIGSSELTPINNHVVVDSSAKPVGSGEHRSSEEPLGGFGVPSSGGGLGTGRRIVVPVPTVQGSLSMDEVRRRVQAIKHRVSHCYKDALAKNPNLQGKLNVEFTVESDGHVSKVDADSGTTLTDKRMQTCVFQAFQKMQFSPLKNSGKAVVVYPITFRTAM
jgi:TonB family protein